MGHRLYVYKLTTDNGGAPCVKRGLLSLAICKPSIRRTASEGDWIFGFGGRDLDARLIYIARISRAPLRSGSYYVDDTFKSRDDRIYCLRNGKFALRENAQYPSDGSQLEHDLGKAPLYAQAVTLLSDDFRYWGKRGTSNYRGTFPEIGKLLDRLTRGHRVNFSDAARRELVELQHSQWRKYPNSKVLGAPTDGDRHKLCNRSEGRIESSKPLER
jgi:hypothetical protein